MKNLVPTVLLLASAAAYPQQRFLAKLNNFGYSGTAVVEITGSDFVVRRKVIYR